VLLLILGVIGMTQEYRHRTATPTFLTTPRRGNVVIGKLIAYALVAVPFALLILAVNVLVVEIYAGARGDAPALNADNLQTLGAASIRVSDGKSGSNLKVSGDGFDCYYFFGMITAREMTWDLKSGSSVCPPSAHYKKDPP